MRVFNQHGFTLVELMVALAITSIISAAMYSAYTSQQRINQAQDQIVEMQQNLRAGLDMMVRELRMAGYDPDDTGTAGFTAADATSLTFTMIAEEDNVDNDGDTLIDEVGEIKTIHYRLFDGYGDGDRDGDGVVTCGNGVDVCDLGRQVGDNPNSIRVLIENVENLEFMYSFVSGVPSTTPSAADIANDRIRSIQISVLARASGISLNYVNNQVYTTGSGSNWGPFNDNIRRRMQVISVHCRNMGW